MNSIFVSSTLSVSQKNRLNCERMAKILSKNKINTSITSTVSTTPRIEYGCRLTQSISSKEDIRNIWSILKKKYDFTCGHLIVNNSFDGCVLKYLDQMD